MTDDYPRVMQRKVLPSVEQTPTRGSSKLTNPLRMSVHVSSCIEQTPTRGPSKLVNPLGNSALKGTSELFNPLAPPTILDQGPRLPKQLFGKSHVSELPPSWPLEVHDTPSKAASSKQSCLPSWDRPQETPVKAQRAEESSESTVQGPQETPIQPARASKVSAGFNTRVIVPGAPIPTEDSGQSIYESLGWDDVDELL